MSNHVEPSFFFWSNHLFSDGWMDGWIVYAKQCHFFQIKSPIFPGQKPFVQACPSVQRCVRSPRAFGRGAKIHFLKGLDIHIRGECCFPPKKNWVLRYIHVYIYYHILYIEIIFLHNYIYIYVCVDVYIYNIYIYIYTTQTQPTRHIDSNRLYTYAKNYAYLNIILCNYVYI